MSKQVAAQQKLPNLTPLLPIKIGPRGQLYEVDFQKDMPDGGQYERFFDYLYSRGFSAYALQTPMLIPKEDAEYFKKYSKEYKIDTHLITNMTHSYKQPLFRNPLKVNAAITVQCQRALSAWRAGMKSFTIHPPPKEYANMRDFRKEVQAVKQFLADNKAKIRLHVCNGVDNDTLLPTIKDLKKFIDSEPDIYPTIHISSEYANTQKEYDADKWLKIIKEMPTETIYLYSNLNIYKWQRMGVREYNHEAEANTPALDPFLSAARQSRRKLTILIRGSKSENDAFEAMLSACETYEKESEEILKKRQGRHTHGRKSQSY